MPVDDAASVKQVRRERLMFALGGVAVNINIAEQSLNRWFLIAASQANYHYVNMRHTARIATPCECAMSEADFESVPLKKNRPKLGNLLPLSNRTGRHKPYTRF